MMENTLWIISMGMENSNGPLEMFTKGTTLMTSGMAMGRCIGLMEASIKVNGLKEFSMVLAKCIFQMEARKLVSLKIMFLREVKSSLPSHIQTKHFRKSLQFKDQILS